MQVSSFLCVALATHLASAEIIQKQIERRVFPWERAHCAVIVKVIVVRRVPFHYVCFLVLTVKNTLLQTLGTTVSARLVQNVKTAPAAIRFEFFASCHQGQKRLSEILSSAWHALPVWPPNSMYSANTLPDNTINQQQQSSTML
jgi:hypothetical protein